MARGPERSIRKGTRKPVKKAVKKVAKKRSTRAPSVIANAQRRNTQQTAARKGSRQAKRKKPSWRDPFG